MTTKEAIQAMLDGKKVVPSVWSDELYIMFNGTHFIREDGNQFLFGQLVFKWELYEEHKLKQTVTIEKWLIKYPTLKMIVEVTNIEMFLLEFGGEKVKLIDIYKVEI